MRLDDHNPPHFHADYGGQIAVFDIRTLGMTEGSLPGRIHGLIIEWASYHREELMAAWEAAKTGKVPNQIEPLS